MSVEDLLAVLREANGFQVLDAEDAILAQCAVPVDGDGDGLLGSVDLCPGTPAGAAVDDSGCSRAQFCAAQPVQGSTPSRRVRACRTADWRSDGTLDCWTRRHRLTDCVER